MLVFILEIDDYLTIAKFHVLGFLVASGYEELLLGFQETQLCGCLPVVCNLYDWVWAATWSCMPTPSRDVQIHKSFDFKNANCFFTSTIRWYFNALECIVYVQIMSVMSLSTCCKVYARWCWLFSTLKLCQFGHYRSCINDQQLTGIDQLVYFITYGLYWSASVHGRPVPLFTTFYWSRFSFGNSPHLSYNTLIRSWNNIYLIIAIVLSGSGKRSKQQRSYIRV